MNNKSIALFDMDGTLTPVRKKMRDDMVTAVNELSNHCKIGVITGSKYAYVVEQIPQLFNNKIISKHMIDIMPCNGTKLYTYADGQYNKVSEVNMIEKIGRESYNFLVKEADLQRMLTVATEWDHVFAVRKANWEYTASPTRLLTTAKTENGEEIRLSDHNGYMTAITIKKRAPNNKLCYTSRRSLRKP